MLPYPRTHSSRYVCCLTQEDGQGPGLAGQRGRPRPLHGIRPKAHKRLNRHGRVLQDPHAWVPLAQPALSDREGSLWEAEGLGTSQVPPSPP